MHQSIPLLEVRHLSKRFKGEKKIFHALHQVNLKIFQGEIFGIIGPSGAGKSTLLRCLSSLEPPTDGEVLFGEENISLQKGAALRSFRKQMGMVFQNFQLLNSRTVAENIAFPLEISGMNPATIESRIDELLEWVSLTDKKNAYPAQLSGGQKQRVGIARALAVSPKLLFCDEATSALDSSATQQILELLKRLQKQLNLTIVIITHEMEVIRQICDRVAVISHGEIVEQRKTADLFFAPEHDITKKLLQNTHHHLPNILPASATCKTARLSFRGDAAREPIISTMIRTCQIDANILSGWIDLIKGESVGTLIVELSGEEKNLSNALAFLQQKRVGVELLGNHHV